MSATPPTTPPAAATVVRDPHSAARPEEARVTHVALDLAADFAAKTLAGTATLTLARTGSAPTLVLDTADLTILKVTDALGHALSHALGARDAVLGQPLTITLTPDVTKVVVEVPDLAAGGGAAVAVAVADRRQEAAVSVLAGPGDPDPHVAADAGQPGHPPDLRGADHRAGAAGRGDERRASDPGRRAAARRPPPLRVPADPRRSRRT